MTDVEIGKWAVLALMSLLPFVAGFIQLLHMQNVESPIRLLFRDGELYFFSTVLTASVIFEISRIEDSYMNSNNKIIWIILLTIWLLFTAFLYSAALRVKFERDTNPNTSKIVSERFDDKIVNFSILSAVLSVIFVVFVIFQGAKR